MASILADEGCAVSEAANGSEALRCLDQARFDAIVLDLEMPGMDGRSFYRQMLKRGPPVPTLIVSAHGARAAARELRADASLQKPFDIDQFVELLAGIIVAPGSNGHGAG